MTYRLFLFLLCTVLSTLTQGQLAALKTRARLDRITAIDGDVDVTTI